MDSDYCDLTFSATKKNPFSNDALLIFIGKSSETELKVPHEENSKLNFDQFLITIKSFLIVDLLWRMLDN